MYVGTEHRDTKATELTPVHSSCCRYRAQGHEGNRANTSTFFLLLDLLTFFDYYHVGNMDEALTVSVIQNVHIYIIYCTVNM